MRSKKLDTAETKGILVSGEGLGTRPAVSASAEAEGDRQRVRESVLEDGEWMGQSALLEVRAQETTASLLHPE